nr:hypothetical protein [Tanacetum cinerariifolium]
MFARAVGTDVPPKTKAQELARKNELKAKSTLLLAILDEHLLKFHSIKDAKLFGKLSSIINETVNVAHDILVAGSKEQLSASSYADDIDTDDLEEMDLKWQVAIITIEAQESSTKRTTEHLESYIFKKQKVDENVELAVDDSVELRKCIEIVPDDGNEVLIEATPISSRSPTIIDYKIHKKRKKNYFKIIRADGNSQVYQTFEKMFKNFNREDLEVLWARVKDRFKKEKPVDDMDNVLFRTLNTMFEHHVEDTI